MTGEFGNAKTHIKGRCRRCERKDGKRHVYAWTRSRKRLLRDARCPTCASPLKGSSNELREPIVRHEELPVFVPADVRTTQTRRWR